LLDAAIAVIIALMASVGDAGAGGALPR
jgi:hypothetical protein